MEKTVESKLSNDGKPEIELLHLNSTIIKTPTHKLYDRLMKIYEVGGWVSEDGMMPTEKFVLVGPTTHVLASNYFKIIDSPEDFIKKERITVNEFCDKENIDKLKQREINKYFRYEKGYRASMGQRMI